MDQVVCGESTLVRLICFFAVFAVMALWESRWRLREASSDKLKRMRANIGLLLVGALVMRIVFPMSFIGLAVYADSAGIGLLNVINMPVWVAIVLTLLLLDLALYAQHVAFHWVPVLWRVHRVHHTDRDLDVTSGFRFHPIEMVVSTLYKSVLIVILGLPANGIFVFAILLNASSMFNHSNARIVAPLEWRLRKFIVTPAMHWIHHSVVPAESQRNFGFNLSCWDRLFGTYLDSSAQGIGAMQLGIEGYNDSTTAGFVALLTQPWTHADHDSGNRYELNSQAAKTRD